MKKRISKEDIQKRDRFFRDIFGDKELFYYFLRDFAKATWLPARSPENLEELPADFVNIKTGDKHSDIIYKLTINEQSSFIILLLEH